MLQFPTREHARTCDLLFKLPSVIVCGAAVAQAQVREFGLEIHVAILTREGEVDFVGCHPQQEALLDESRYSHP